MAVLGHYHMATTVEHKLLTVSLIFAIFIYMNKIIFQTNYRTNSKINFGLFRF